MSYDYDGEETWREDPLAADCIHGGLGCYVLLDGLCDFSCPWRDSCRRIKKRAESKRQGKIWRRLFQIEEVEKVGK